MDEMNENEVMAKYHELTEQLRDALARMEYSDRVFVIREEIKELQSVCPHKAEGFDLSDLSTCPYCGKKFRK